MSLNYYGINKVLGGTMVAGRRAQFGGFGTLGTAGELLRNRPATPKPVAFSYAMDAKVVKAFEAVREGSAPERILWDTKLAGRFHRKARDLGVHAPARQLNRRLIGIRKNPGRYRKHGIELSLTRAVEPQPSIVPEYAHAVEFALVRLRVRYGVSIDDILLDPELANEYEQLASQIATDLSSRELRLGALYIRKTRHVAKEEQSLFEQMDSQKMEGALQSLGSLDKVDATRVPASEGLVEVLESTRPIYIARNENLRSMIQEFSRGTTLLAMANHFWTPKKNMLEVRIYPEPMFLDTAIQRWQLKLIQEKKPVFNWPVLKAA